MEFCLVHGWVGTDHNLKESVIRPNKLGAKSWFFVDREEADISRVRITS